MPHPSSCPASDEARRRDTSASMRSVESDYRVACCHSSEAPPIEQAAPRAVLWKGTFRPGFAADLAVLSDDPTQVPAESLKDLSCALTMVGGRVVHTTLGSSGGVLGCLSLLKTPNRGEFLRRRHTVVGMIAILSALVAAPPWNLEVVALRHQVVVLRRQRSGRLRLFRADRLLWVWLYRILAVNAERRPGPGCLRDRARTDWGRPSRAKSRARAGNRRRSLTSRRRRTVRTA